MFCQCWTIHESDALYLCFSCWYWRIYSFRKSVQKIQAFTWWMLHLEKELTCSWSQPLSQWQHEPCLFGFGRTKEGTNSSPDRETNNYLGYDRPKSSKDHPTMKPVQLMKPSHFKTHPMRGTLVLDPFLGSGSTLIMACENKSDLLWYRIGWLCGCDCETLLWGNWWPINQSCERW